MKKTLIVKSRWTRTAALVIAIVALGAWAVFALEPGAEIALTAEPTIGFISKLGLFIGEFVALLLIAGLPLFCIVHMFIVIFKTRQLKNAITVEQMTASRLKKGMSENSNQEGNVLCYELIAQATQCFTLEETNEDGRKTVYPKNLKEVRCMQKFVEEAGKLLPTDVETLQVLNEHREVVYKKSKRNFNGSHKLLWLSGFVSLTLCFFVLPMGIMFALYTGVYYLASCVPEYMIAKKEQHGGGGGWFTGMLVASGLGVLGNGYTVRTRYSDSTTEDDNSAHFLAQASGLAILFMIACTIIIWATISYLRNYVLYW